MHDWPQIAFFIAALILTPPLLGRYLNAIYCRNAGWPEKACCRLAGVNPAEEMTWTEYGKSLFLFNLFGFAALFFLQLLQGYLPLNPQKFGAVSWHSSFNTAASFVTNTNWQGYAGETTMSYLTQMLGLGAQSFFSAASGMSVLLVLIRGLTRHASNTIGNFWSDLVRTILYLLLPLSIILSLVLVSEGAVQTLSPYVEAAVLEKGTQTIPLGPAASQVAVSQLGSNGGGFFNANRAHPFENPTGLTNFLEMISILLIPAASVYTYGIMIGSMRHARLLFCVMLALWSAGAALSFYAQHIPNPVINASPYMEGIDTRLGIANSLLWSVSTTVTSNGSTNALLSSLSPLSGGVAMFNIMLGECIFGGIGVGLCSMIMFALLTVFLSGLMVGRTPEYLGKKIERHEIQWVMMAILLPSALILIGSGLSSVLPASLSSVSHEGPHGLSEILYAFSSSAGNNGSSFAGLNANTPYYNLALGVVMLLARLSILLPSLAIAGLLAKKKITPPSKGTFSTDSVLFALLLFSVILIIGGLTFFPALSLGPIIEHLLMLEGRAF